MLNTLKAARTLVRLQQRALQASGDKRGDSGRGQASSVPACTGTAVSSPNTHSLRDLCIMYVPILILVLQNSDGSHGSDGLGVKAHTSKLVLKPLPKPASGCISQLVSDAPGGILSPHQFLCWAELRVSLKSL